MKKIFKFISFIILFVTLISTLILGVLFLMPSSVKFDEKKLINTENFIEIYDINNNVIEVTNLSKKQAKSTQLNNYTKNAFIAIEDKNFYTHKGIDVKRIFSAALKNLTSFSYKQGASTISQQLIKNTHLSQKKTIRRKIDEIKLALKLEKTFSKDEILEMYLNTIYFGENAYGIEQASKTYFNKPASNLTINESALLAGIIKSPSKLNPKQNFEGAINRKNLVLQKLNEQNYISNEDVIKLKNEEIKLDFDNNYEKDKSYIKGVLNEFSNFSQHKPYTFSNCKIYTKFNKYLQKVLVENNPEINTDYQSLILDNNTSAILAYYSTCGEIERNPASTVKPWLVYGPAINEKLISPLTQITDEQIDFNGYTPHNYGNKYYGNVSCEKALALSLNVPAVKLLQTVGVDTAKNYAKKMNFEINSNGLGISLGSFDNNVNLKTLTGAYSTFANLGLFKKPHFIEKIIDVNGNVIYEYNDKPINVFTSATASLVSKMLNTTVKEGTAKGLRSLPFEIYAKTGTNGFDNGNLDAYSIAYTKDHTFSCWLGNKDNKLMDNSITGSNHPTKALREIILQTYKNNSPHPMEFTDIIKLKIDKKTYETTGEITLCPCDDPNSYVESYFDINNQPTKTATNFESDKIVDYNINFNNDIVEINYNLTNNLNVEIVKIFNNKEEICYVGNKNYKEKLKNFGIYEFIIRPFTYKYGEKIYEKEIPLKKINFNKGNLIPTEFENWWNE